MIKRFLNWNAKWIRFEKSAVGQICQVSIEFHCTIKKIIQIRPFYLYFATKSLSCYIYHTHMYAFAFQTIRECGKMFTMTINCMCLLKKVANRQRRTVQMACELIIKSNKKVNVNFHGKAIELCLFVTFSCLSLCVTQIFVHSKMLEQFVLLLWKCFEHDVHGPCLYWEQRIATLYAPNKRHQDV